MVFSEALSKTDRSNPLGFGKIRRFGWRKGTYVRGVAAGDPKSISVNTKHLVIVTSENEVAPWLPSHEDIFSNEWEEC